MRIKSQWLAILLAIGLVLAACSPGGTDDTTTTAGESPTTTAGGGDEPTTTLGEEMAPPEVDNGVDLDAGVIRVGLLSDLTGPFSSLVQIIVSGHEVYWDNVNANGGINGLQVELVVEDTGYVVDNHIQKYEQIKDDVVAFGHSTGSPHTVAINSALQEDGLLAMPLTWYSGWSDTNLNSNLLHHGVSYCLEAMNMIGWLKDQMGDQIQSIAIATWPGDYGLDSYEGAKLAAEALGLEVVYDGGGDVIATDEATITEAANGIVASGADLVWVTTSSGNFSSIFGQALAQGFQAIWSGAGPSYNPAFIAPDSPIKDAIAASTYWSAYYANYGQSNPGLDEAKQLVADAGVLQTPVSAIFEGMVEARILHLALQAAYDAGDMTQAGVLAAAKSLDSLDLNGLGPNEVFTGTSNDQVQRVSHSIWVPDPDGLASGANAGESPVVENYTHPITEAYQFDGACYVLEG
jgi:ABC-type branched-subunit amino acid transport system substrate-binding protein